MDGACLMDRKVEIHPLVSAFITDHLLRANLPCQEPVEGLKPVCGVLVGREESGPPSTVHVKDVFPVDEVWKSEFDTCQLKLIMAEYYKGSAIVGWYQSVVGDSEKRPAIYRKLKELTGPAEPILLVFEPAEQLTVFSLSVMGEGLSEGESGIVAFNLALTKIKWRESKKEETTFDRVLRLNLLSFDKLNPLERWRSSPAHHQLVNEKLLRRPWLGLRPRFWDYYLTHQQELYASPSEISVMVQQSCRLRSEKNYHSAESFLDNHLSLHPLDPELLEERGVVAEEKGNLLEAENFYHPALAQNPHQADAKRRLEGLMERVERIHSEALLRVWEKAGELEHVPRCNPELKRSLRASFYRSVHTTLAIEGNAMTQAETTEVFDNEHARIEARSGKDHAEVLGIKEAIEYVIGGCMRVGAITLQNLLDIHGLVECLVEDMRGDAGSLRKCCVCVGNLLTPISERLPVLMADFVRFLNSPTTLQSIDIIELAVHAHLWEVMIHPFKDGNGRATRLLMDFFLLQAGFPSLVVPVEEPKRGEYYNTLRQATFGAERPFVMFVTSLLGDVLKEHSSLVSHYTFRYTACSDDEEHDTEGCCDARQTLSSPVRKCPATIKEEAVIKSNSGTYSVLRSSHFA